PIPDRYTKHSLLADLQSARAHLVAAFDRADPHQLAAPHGREYLAATPLRSVRDVVHQLLTVHAGYHIGQLSVYRRATGKPPLF
ncbi:MAG: hypothetical protein IBJ11_12735, partial [Phycisphaerales bacterium]|nr:hypothetical protein [Phycisphaerales bacterium]